MSTYKLLHPNIRKMYQFHTDIRKFRPKPADVRIQIFVVGDSEIMKIALLLNRIAYVHDQEVSLSHFVIKKQKLFQ